MFLLLVYLFLLVIPFGFATVRLSNRSSAHISNATDQEAMLGFMSAIMTYNPSQALPTDWKSNVSVCEWTSIRCSGHRVVYLNVSGMGLEGTLSPLLGNLSFLVKLDLSHNNFHGPIPYQLGNLFRLHDLFLNMNQLQGSIPPTLGGCRSLTTLSLSRNYLRGNIPSELCALSNLQNYDSGYNHLSGTIPACLGNMSSLVYINLQNNNLHGRLPSDLCTRSFLRSFIVWNNSLTGQIPSSFSNCTHLQELTLSNNYLTGHIPSELCTRHTQWLGLYLYGNYLSGSIPSTLFNCTKLQVIEFGKNQLSGVVPMELGKLTKLQRLRLSYNQLISGSSTSLPILTALINCTSLRELVLYSNNLTGRLSSSIGQLSKTMSMLDLGFNDVTGEIPPHIGNLTSLTYLNLEKNHFSGAIPFSLNRLQRLERLYLSFNNLDGNIPMEIGELKCLGVLSVGGNNLTGRIPKSVGYLEQLEYLILRNNQLSGTIPAALGKCVKLLHLDLSFNRLRGHIPPELGGLVNLAQGFRISNNLLEGTIPLGLSKIIMVQVVDLSCNALGGHIPASLGEILNLQYIDFSFNNLSGEIPISLEKLKMLSYLNFSFNKLSGEVPKDGIFKRLGATAFMGNVGLCGSWVGLTFCSAREHKSHFLVERVIISVGAVFAILILCLFLGILWRRNHKRLMALVSLKVGHQRISYRELVTATDEFSDSNLLGVGSFGKVYKGVMYDGTIVAVKVISLENEGANKSFERECNVLSRVRHRNLIKIITCYSDLDFKALIFPFMENGSLEKWLYPNGEESSSALSLIQRLNIAIDIAHGLAYLHHHCFMQVIHCDLKPNNVLLGDDLTAYLIDFGIATIYFANSKESASVSTYALKGSLGYIPPEYGQGGQVTTKGDVYSYGIVLLEVLTRKKPTHSLFVEGMDLKKWVSSGFPNQLEKVVDSSLLKTSNTNTTEGDKKLICLGQLIRVGLLCTQQSPQRRPNMMDVVDTLESIRDTFLETTPKSNSNQISYERLLGSSSNTADRAGTSDPSNNAGDSDSSSF
eukprot:PITA_32763